MQDLLSAPWGPVHVAPGVSALLKAETRIYSCQILSLVSEQRATGVPGAAPVHNSIQLQALFAKRVKRN
jgi:hypothetical protein